MKKAFHISLFTLFILIVFGLMGFIYVENSRQTLGGTQVRIIREGNKGFLTGEDILKMTGMDDTTMVRRADELDPAWMEGRLLANPFVARADVFVNIEKNLVINIQEKRPFLRVFNRQGKSFYLDDEGKPFPLSDRYAYHTLVASGYIDIAIDQPGGLPGENGKQQILIDLHRLTSAIKQSEFLSAQVSQIYLNSKGEYDLVPELGDHIIKLGTLEDLDDKLMRLELWYRKSFVASGDRYSTVSLKFRNQVVCTKK